MSSATSTTDPAGGGADRRDEILAAMLIAGCAPSPAQKRHFSSEPAVVATRWPNAHASWIATTPMPSFRRARAVSRQRRAARSRDVAPHREERLRSVAASTRSMPAGMCSVCRPAPRSTRRNHLLQQGAHPDRRPQIRSRRRRRSHHVPRTRVPDETARPAATGTDRDVAVCRRDSSPLRQRG